MNRPTLTHIACSAVLAGALFGATALPASAAVATGSKTPAATVAVKAKSVTQKPASKKIVRKARTVAKAQLTTFESQLLTDINRARHAAGVGPLVAAPGTTDMARRWTLTLAHNATLSHNPDLVTDAQRAGSNAWTWLGENVGTGPAGDAPDLFAAYMASPHHRDNILDPHAKFIGIGVVQTTNAQGQPVAYNTCDFTDAYSSSYGADKTPALPHIMTVRQAAAALAR